MISLRNTYDEIHGINDLHRIFDVEAGINFRAIGWLIGDGQVKSTCLVARGKRYIWHLMLCPDAQCM